SRSSQSSFTCTLQFFRSCLCSPRRHPDLPSFPTRRSSDLDDGRLISAERVVAEHRAQRLEGGRIPGRGGGCRDRRHRRGAPVDRSEEHTSELQSRENLVCRLLLEKKKGDRAATPRQRHG